MRNESRTSGSGRGGKKPVAERRHGAYRLLLHVTVFRDDLDEAVSIEALEALSNKKRRARLDAIRDACRAYITGPLYNFLGAQISDATKGAGRVEIDPADPDGQTLLLWYPEVEPRDGAYVRPAVRLESGAKSALDPHQPVPITPYIGDEAPDLNLVVADVATIEAGRRITDNWVGRLCAAYLSARTSEIGLATANLSLACKDVRFWYRVRWLRCFH